MPLRVATTEGSGGEVFEVFEISAEMSRRLEQQETREKTSLAAAGGGDALRAFAEARAGATSTGAIQVPNVTVVRHTAAAAAAAAAGASWSEEDVNAIGLNPLTANVRQQQ